MLTASYNNKALNDTLIVLLKKSKVVDQQFERIKNVTKIIDKQTDEVVGFNFFNISSVLEMKADGPVRLSEEQVAKLNQTIKEVGFDVVLDTDPDPKIVVGYVKECNPHEDSDHLSVTQTEVDEGKVLQIICGASNIKKGQKVVVAKEGAILPDGTPIWPGELRGVKSEGMICSAPELKINDNGEQEGILVLDDTEELGKDFQKYMNL